MSDFWDVVEDSVAKKNNDKNKKFKYVFHANITIFLYWYTKINKQ
jgi:predicted branched-subunit amino acid permease